MLTDNPVARVSQPDEGNPEAGLLVAWVQERQGTLERGPNKLVIPFQYGSEQANILCWTCLMEEPLQPASDITLGGVTFKADPELVIDIAAALLSFQVLIELGDLLLEYPPNPGSQYE